MAHNSSLSPEQKEQTRHGEHMFPLKKYITTLTELYPSVSAHWHDEAELTLISEGSCTYQVHLDNYDVSEGDLLLCPLLFSTQLPLLPRMACVRKHMCSI